MRRFRRSGGGASVTFLLEVAHLPCACFADEGRGSEVADSGGSVLARAACGVVDPGVVQVAVPYGRSVTNARDDTRRKVKGPADDLAAGLARDERRPDRLEFGASGMLREPGAQRVHGIGGCEVGVPKRAVGSEYFL